MLRYNPLLRHCEKKRNLFERKGNFKRHLRIPHSSPFLPIIHFSRAHASLEPLIFSPLILPLCARLNSISIHAKSAPNSLFDCATIIYTYICTYIYVQCNICIRTHISRTSLHPKFLPHSYNLYRIFRHTHFRRIADPIMHNIAEHSLLVQRGRRSFNLVTSIASLLEYREFIEAEGTFE